MYLFSTPWDFGVGVNAKRVGGIEVVLVNPKDNEALVLFGHKWRNRLAGVKTVFNEVPGGVIDGVNKIFTTTKRFVPESITLYIRGVRQLRGVHYTEIGDTQIELDTPPQIGDNLIVDYIEK